MNTIPMNRMTTTLAAVSFALVATACGQGMAPEATVAAADVSATWSNAFNTGDSAALAALYTDDARTMPPGGPAVVGRGQIESYWSDDIGTGGATTTLMPTDAIAVGDLLHVEGTYLVEGENDAELARGQYLQLWTRAGDGWQVRREMWRTDPALQRGGDLAERLTSSWTAAYNAGDVKALAGLYSESATVSTIQEGSFSGPNAIESFWAGDFGAAKPQSALTLTDVYVAGELAHLEGTYTVTEGEDVTEGRYVQLWMREGNAWLIHREMWLR